MLPSCQHVTKSGSKCRAPARASGYCYFHDPKTQEARVESRRKGGLNSRRYSPLSEVKIPETLGDVKVLLAKVMAEVARGTLDPRISNAVARAAAELNRSIELSRRDANREQADALADTLNALDEPRAAKPPAVEQYQRSDPESQP